MAQPRVPLADRFWSKVDKSGGPDACWLWTGQVNHGGYGIISAGAPHRTKYLRAPRVAWELTNGEILPGEEIRHWKCDNPPCCNPAHFRTGTRLDNVRDMYEHGRERNPGAPGERNANAKLTEESVRAIRQRREHNESLGSIARDLRVTKQLVALVAKRKAWRHVA